MRGRRARAGVERGEQCRAGQRVALRAAVELQREVRQAGPGKRDGIDAIPPASQLLIQQSEARQWRQRGIGRHRDQAAAGVRKRHAGQHDDVVGRERGRRERRCIGDPEGVEAFRAQDLGIEGAERRAGRGHDQDRPARTIGRRGMRCAWPPRQRQQHHQAREQRPQAVHEPAPSRSACDRVA
jgi:hypothetical protein